MFICSEEAKAILENWAEDEGRTVSNLVERIVSEAIENKGKQYKERLYKPTQD
jgi:hypothetical protein